MIYCLFSELELNVFANEEYACTNHGSGKAIPSLMSAADDDKKSEVMNFFYYLPSKFTL